MKKTIICECSDPGCKAHEGEIQCKNRALFVVRRIDMDEGTTTFDFCRACMEDALESGVFDMEEE